MLATVEELSELVFCNSVAELCRFHEQFHSTLGIVFFALFLELRFCLAIGIPHGCFSLFPRHRLVIFVGWLVIGNVRVGLILDRLFTENDVHRFVYNGIADALEFLVL